MHLRVCRVTWSEGTLPGALVAFLLAVTALAAAAAARAQNASAEMEFDIPAGALAEALDRFSEQSGLQIVYDHHMARSRRAPRVAGPMSPARALDRLLRKSGAVWSYLDGDTVAIRAPLESLPQPQTPEPAAPSETAGSIAGVVRLADNLFGQPGVLIPATMEQLDESHATLGQPPRQQTVESVGARLTRLRAVEIKGPLRLA